MESKTSLSPFGDDRRSLNQSPSALRAFTSSRLSLTRGRSRGDSCSTSSTSSASTRSSIDSTTSPACVTRHVSPDQCALHRFIVWAAVQRNSCQKMTAAERLECPLLRCRKRFPSHEDMLRHLYTCEQLSSGEYWCYDCAKAEKFTDGKCKRCLGHPGKRHRIMSVAKNFFSSLGQKSKHQNVLDHHMDEEASLPQPPPSYDSVVQPQQVELSSSTEILEIDSTEVPFPPQTTDFAGTSAFDNKPFDTFEHQSTAPEASLSIMPELSFDWGLQNSFDVNDMARGDRPSLSVHTHGLSQYRKQHKQHKPTTRTKNLSHSSSLRSNASTDTTASYLVSPASNFSTAWTNTDTSLTSPTTEGGYLSRGCSNASHYSNASRYSNNPDLHLHSFISELPAEDIMLDLPQTLPDDLGCEQQFLSFAMADPVIETAPIKRTKDVQAVVEAPETHEPASFVDPDSLVRSAWDTLKAHVSSSLEEKLQHLSHNPLVLELQSLSPQRISGIGLATLKAILDGRQPASAIETLCFVHVTYSLSLIVYENDVLNRSKKLYAQAYLYGKLFRFEEKEAYLEVAEAIWQPLHLSEAEMKDLQNRCRGYPSLNGKGHVTKYPGHDTLVEVAQFFLDELEYTSNGTNSSNVVGSEIWSQHFQDDSAPIIPAFTETVVGFSKMLRQERFQSRSFATAMERFQKRVRNGGIRVVRRAELELLQAGKGCMSWQDYFDNYVPKIRVQFVAHCEQRIPGFTPRSVYHIHGIELLQRTIDAICQKEAIKYAPKDSSQDENLDEFIRTLTNDLEITSSDLLIPDNFTFEDPIPDIQVSADLADPMIPMCNGRQEDGMDIVQPLPTPENSTTCTSPDTVQGTQPDSGAKVEVHAHDCCDICGYRPKGDPQWFKGSMAKHKKLQHSTAPPKIYRCPYPGCTSQYKNRPDNLKQHQQDKGHFVGGETERRPSKRKRRGNESV